MDSLEIQLSSRIEPEARREPSRWWSAAEQPDCGQFIGALRRCARSSPKVSVVEFDQAALQHRQVLLLEGRFLMVLLLIKDVGTYLFQIWRTDRESSIAFLPRELRQSNGLFNPSGRISFHLPHHVTQPMSRLQARQKVNVIANSPDSQTDTALAINNAAQIGMNSRSNLRIEPILPILGAEDQVVIKRGMGRGHRSTLAPPSGRIQFPTKTGGFATLHHRLGSRRASGSFRNLVRTSTNPYSRFPEELTDSI